VQNEQENGFVVKADTEKIIEHLSNYYQLTDDGRRDVDDFIKALIVAESKL